MVAEAHTPVSPLSLIDTERIRIDKLVACGKAKARTMEEMIERHANDRKLTAKMLVAIEGEEIVDFRGNVISHRGGLVNEMASVKGEVGIVKTDIAELKHLANGGGGFSVRNKDKLVIGAIAAVPGLGTLLIAYLALSGGG